MADTPSTRSVSDYLWDWAGNKHRKKLLVHKVVSNEAELHNEDREEVFSYLMQDIGIVDGLNVIEIEPPVYQPNSTRIKLISIENIQGVNKLSNDEKLQLGDKLTVIYGENGSGKTGYCRVLKSLVIAMTRIEVLFIIFLRTLCH